MCKGVVRLVKIGWTTIERQQLEDENDGVF